MLAVTLLASGWRGVGPPRLAASTSRVAAPRAVLDTIPEDSQDAQQRRAISNGVTIGALAACSAYGILHDDVGAIASLYAQPDWSIPDVTSRWDVAVSVFARLPSDWLGWYDAEALAMPILTKASTSAACYFVGDLTAQCIGGKNVATIDLARASRSSAAGFIGHGPVAHYWLQFVDEYLSFNGAWVCPLRFKRCYSPAVMLT